MGIPIPNIRETFMDLSNWRKRAHGLNRIGPNNLTLTVTLGPRDPKDPQERNYIFVLTAENLLFTFMNEKKDQLTIWYDGRRLMITSLSTGACHGLPATGLHKLDPHSADQFTDNDLLRARQYLIEGFKHMRLKTPVGDSGDPLTDLATIIEEILGPDVVKSLRATSS